MTTKIPAAMLHADVTTMMETVAASAGASFPSGVMVDYAGATAPDGWLMCYGQAVNRTTYATLFAAIGTAHGVGDGSTTFNLPDFRGRVAAGKDDMGGAAASRLTTVAGGVDGAALGAAGGGQTHTLTEAQIPSHTHTGSTSSDGAHTHTTSAYNNSGTKLIAGTDGSVGVEAITSSSGGAHTHTVTIGSTGSGQAHPIVQPTLVVNKIIKT